MMRPTALTLTWHVLGSLGLGSALIILEHNAQDPNIGAGAVSLVLLLLGLPWSVIGIVVRLGPHDLWLFGSVLVNLVAHLGLVLASRNKGATAPPPMSNAVKTSALGACAIMVIAFTALGLKFAGSASEEYNSARQFAIRVAEPTNDWALSLSRSDGGPTDCRFCRQDSLQFNFDAKATGRSRDTSELRSDLDHQFAATGATPTNDWECSGEPVLCTRNFSSPQEAVFARLSHRTGDSTLTLDVNRR